MNPLKSVLSALNINASLSSQPADSEENRNLRYADEQIQKVLEAILANDFNQAKHCANEAEKQFLRYQRAGGMANVLMRRGQIDFAEEKYEEAKTKFLEASKQYQELNQDLGQANCLCLLGIYYKQIKEYAVASEMFEEAIRVYTQIQAIPSRQHTVDIYFQCLFEMIGHLADQKNHQHAAELAMNALEKAQKENHREAQSNFVNIAGRIAFDNENYPQAITLWHEALNIFTELGDKAQEAHTFASIADVYQKQERYEEAKSCYRWCLEVFLRLGLPDSVGRVYNNLAIIYDTQNDWDTTLFLVTKAIEAYRQTNNEPQITRLEKVVEELNTKLAEQAKQETEEPKEEPESES